MYTSITANKGVLIPMRRHRRPQRSEKAVIGGIIFTVILLLLIAAAVKADKSLRPVAAMQAEHFAVSSTNEIIGETVSDYLSENKFTYSDFSAVLYDESGKAVSIETIPYNINKVQSDLNTRINKALSISNAHTERIPVGSLTGSYVLVGKGPEIKIKVCPAGSADVKLKSSFESAGINQTCHRISAVVNVQLQSSVPLYSFSSSASFEFLIAENILVGSVPEISRYAWNSI